MQFSTTLTYNANTNQWAWTVVQFPGLDMKPGSQIAGGFAATVALAMNAAATVITPVATADQPQADDTI